MLQILVLASLAESAAEPLETLVKSITGGSAGGLNVLCPKVSLVSSHAKIGCLAKGGVLTHPRCLKLCRPSLSVISAAFMAFCEWVNAYSTNLSSMATHWQILLVGEDQEESVPELILVQHALQLLSCLNHTVAIVGVDNEDDTLGVLEVMPPQRPDLVLSSDIPYGELNVLVLDGLDVESCSKNASVPVPMADGVAWIIVGFAIPIVGIVVTISPSLSL